MHEPVLDSHHPGNFFKIIICFGTIIGCRRSRLSVVNNESSLAQWSRSYLYKHHHGFTILHKNRYGFLLVTAVSRGFSTDSDNKDPTSKEQVTGKAQNDPVILSSTTEEAASDSATPNAAKTLNKEPVHVETIVKVVPRKRGKKIDYAKTYTANNTLTAYRAMTEYLLQTSDLEGLRKTMRRSPYDDKPITVYLRSDVEARSIEKWGSLENLTVQLRSRRDVYAHASQQLNLIKRAVKEYRHLVNTSQDAKGMPFLFQAHDRKPDKPESMMQTGTGKVVVMAAAINFANFMFKMAAWLYTGSHCMFSEMIHSMADTINQRRCTLIMATNELRRKAKKAGVSFANYVMRGEDPNVNVVLTEDTAAVAGIGIAAACMGLTVYTGSPTPDAIGSLVIGGVLGMVAGFIIYTVCIAEFLFTIDICLIYPIKYLIPVTFAVFICRSIDLGRQDKICKELESDVVIRAIHDVKATDMGASQVRFKAEVDFDGHAITQSYLDRIDLEDMLKELQKITTIDKLEAFMTKHGENIIDRLGMEIDRIEAELKKRHPEVRHVDLEVL
ncbi:PREDICTED: zinc transporter 9-like [Priapulus caudatus]|uniref:Zinc transporter 9-like n=1 Tax=Priapulus caudatus TaxID=37621 RepID=A0ABM1DT35_PRICU|nr:PREDICTED: zinc transporter 9-like [Priapulus caudatus]